jgi:hypothetical protein
MFRAPKATENDRRKAAGFAGMQAITGFVGAALIAAALSLPARAAEIHHPTGVLELFTSQGCSSCPAADKVLAGIARTGETLALAWHVDYWDYLGWKDTFARPANTERQRAYARSFAERQVYTPQAVINGRMHVVGSRGEAVANALKQFAGTGEGLGVPIEAALKDGKLKVHVAATPEAVGATLWVVYFEDSAQVQVARGENGGRKLDYTNIVRDMEMIGAMQDRDLMTEFRIADMGNRGFKSCALILQRQTAHGTPGPIVGAVYLTGLDSRS